VSSFSASARKTSQAAGPAGVLLS